MALEYTRPEVVISTLIAAGGLGLTLGTNMFTGPVRPAEGPVPRNAVFIYAVQSFMPRPYFGVSQDFREFRVEIYVRHQLDKFEIGQTLAREVWRTLQRATVSAHTGFFASLMAEADPQYLGLDDTKNHRWIQTDRLFYKG